MIQQVTSVLCLMAAVVPVFTSLARLVVNGRSRAPISKRRTHHERKIGNLSSVSATPSPVTCNLMQQYLRALLIIGPSAHTGRIGTREVNAVEANKAASRWHLPRSAIATDMVEGCCSKVDSPSHVYKYQKVPSCLGGCTVRSEQSPI